MKGLPLGLTFDDVLIKPNYCDINRAQIDLSVQLTPRLKIEVPMLSSPMDTITEWKMAKAVAELGGLGIIHRNLSVEKQICEVKQVMEHHLRVSCALGIDDVQRAKRIVEETGIEVLTIDNAHVHQKKLLEQVEAIKNLGVDLIVGNIATERAARDLINSGADCLKVGIGCGSICKTRIETGIGIPQLHAISETASVVKKYGKTVVADGGIRNGGDIAKAIAAGASAVVLGNVLAGTEEAPGEVLEREGVKCKGYRGMGSEEVLRTGQANRYNQSYLNQETISSEGVKAFVVFRGSAKTILQGLINNLNSSFFYVGAETLSEFQQRARLIRITGAGLVESRPHSVQL